MLKNKRYTYAVQETSVLPAYYCPGPVAVPSTDSERYAGRCGHVCRTGHMGRDCALGLLVLLIVATVIGAMFLLVFFVLQDLTHTGQLTSSGETLLISERSDGTPTIQENRLAGVKYDQTSSFEVREEILLTANHSARQQKYINNENPDTSFVRLHKANNSAGEDDDIFADELQFVSVSLGSSAPPPHPKKTPTTVIVPSSQSGADEDLMKISDEITFHVVDSKKTNLPNVPHSIGENADNVKNKENAEKSAEPVFEPFDVESDIMLTTPLNKLPSYKSTTDSLESEKTKEHEHDLDLSMSVSDEISLTVTTAVPSSSRTSGVPAIYPKGQTRSEGGASEISSTSTDKPPGSTSFSSELPSSSSTKPLSTIVSPSSNFDGSEESSSTMSVRINDPHRQVEAEREYGKHSHASTEIPVKVEIVTAVDVIGLDELIDETPERNQTLSIDDLLQAEDSVKTASSTQNHSSPTNNSIPDKEAVLSRHSSSSNAEEDAGNEKLSEKSASPKHRVLSEQLHRSDDINPTKENESKKSDTFSNQDRRVFNVIEAPANLSTESPLHTISTNTSSSNENYLSIVVSGSQAGPTSSPSQADGIVTAQGIPEWATSTQSTVSYISTSSPVIARFTPTPQRDDPVLSLLNETTMEPEKSASFSSAEKSLEEEANNPSSPAAAFGTEANELLSGFNLAALARDGVSEFVARANSRLQAARSLNLERAALLESSGDVEDMVGRDVSPEVGNEESINLMQDEVVQWLDTNTDFLQGPSVLEYSGDVDGDYGGPGFLPYERHVYSSNAASDRMDNLEKVDGECPMGQFHCGSGTCIPLEHLCDGAEHCPGGFDEVDCFSGDVYTDS